MFQTVRHWWTGGRGKVTLRLFAFEFLVVVAGVLVAQGLASWVQSRASLREMEHSKAQSEHEFAQSLEVALIWQAAVPCLRDRLESIQREAAIGPVRSGSLDRPTLRTPPLGIMAEPAFLFYRQRYGGEAADRHGDVVASNEQLNAEIRTLSRVWSRLSLADERFGQVSTGDRQAVRESAADGLASLRTIGILAHSVIVDTTEMQLKPIPGFPGRGPARDCHAIWSSGRIDPDLSTP